VKAIEITYRYETLDRAGVARPADAQAARRRLDDGSRAFASLLSQLASQTGTARRVIHVDAQDLGIDAEVPGAPAQRPFAAVLGCSDARVPVELIFNEGPNDLFVVRVAGNGLGSEVIGSLRYAIEHLGGSLKLVVVLGHSGCGAVSAAVDVFLEPKGYLTIASNHPLRSILDRLLVSVHTSARRLADVWGPEVVRLDGYRAALIETAVVANAALGAHTLQREVGSGSPDLRTAYGVYCLETREVWAPRFGSASCAGLADPPRDVDDFVALGDAIARSQRIVSILRPGGAQGGDQCGLTTQSIASSSAPASTGLRK
jgi:carbonic anhydrase